MMHVQQRQRATTGRGRPPHPYNLRQALRDFERAYLQNLLELLRWNLSEAAGVSGISEQALRRKIRYYGLEAPETRTRNQSQ
jgi:DNA-binding NtrC family response regulator